MFLPRNKNIIRHTLNPWVTTNKLQLKLAIINRHAMEFISLHFLKKAC
jgi:hypothetical protein